MLCNILLRSIADKQSMSAQTSFAWCMQLSVMIQLPFANQRRVGGQGDYLLSFLDDTMLIGRAQNGTFIFIRDSNS